MELADFQKKLEELPTQIIDQTMLRIIGLKGVAIIRKRTTSGEFLPGSSPGANQYSTTPMPLPFGKLKNKLTKSAITDAGYRVFTSKAGRIWIVLPGGYRQYRQLAGKAADHVSLSWTGRMLRNLKLLPLEEDAAPIGFDDAEEALIASYHNELGAGKSRRKHIFIGFTDAEGDQLGADTAKVITRNLKIYFGE